MIKRNHILMMIKTVRIILPITDCHHVHVQVQVRRSQKQAIQQWIQHMRNAFQLMDQLHYLVMIYRSVIRYPLQPSTDIRHIRELKIIAHHEAIFHYLSVQIFHRYHRLPAEVKHL